MGKIIEVELSKWLKTLDVFKLNKYEMTMLNIILENCEELAKVGTAAGKRAKLIAKKIEEKKCITDKSILSYGNRTMQNEEIAYRINSLKVNSFRGFTNSREFDFSKQYTFFYGPNGSGKSSLSEALEFSLLGMIEEADARNIRVDKYIKNVVTGKGQKPILSCLYSKGTGEAIANLEAYRFSFVEKNRIDKFSHIDASKGKTQSERIAALFGMSEFNEFVR